LIKKQKQYSGTHGTRTIEHPHGKKMNLNTDLISFTKMNSKWITDPNTRLKTVKLQEDNIGDNLVDLGYDDDFLGTTSNA